MARRTSIVIGDNTTLEVETVTVETHKLKDVLNRVLRGGQVVSPERESETTLRITK